MMSIQYKKKILDDVSGLQITDKYIGVLEIFDIVNTG